MDRYAAFIRGIMPSNPNMTGARLRGVFEDLGFAQVSSVLASGNVLFAAADTDAAVLAPRIETALQETLGIPGRTIVRSVAELRALRDSDPFPGMTHGRGSYLTVTFVGRDGPPAIPARGKAEESRGGALSELLGVHAGSRAILAVTDNSVPGRTPEVMVRLEKAYGADITTRTWPTVQRVLAKLEAMG